MNLKHVSSIFFDVDCIFTDLSVYGSEKVINTTNLMFMMDWVVFFQKN